VKPGREGPTAPVQLCGGLPSPNKIVTPACTTTIHMAVDATSTDNASDTSSTTVSKIFRLIKAVNLRGIE
jgi:hypothetical protein